MIKVIYDGGLGNWLFQYCFGRLLAERLGYALDAPPIPGMSGTYAKVEGADYSHLPPRILRGQKPDLSFLDVEPFGHNLLLTGYFQRYEYFLPHRDRIRRWLSVSDEIRSDVEKSDVVLSIRRGRDYIPRYGIPISYYEQALSMLDYDRVFVCTNEPGDPFVRYFVRKYGAVVRGGSFQGGEIQPDYVAGALDNFVFIKKFDKIVMSNSSFPWWAAFLSDASTIIGPRPASGLWARSDPISKHLNLEVPEPRYHFIDCAPYQSLFWKERATSALDKIRRAARGCLRRVLGRARTKRLELERKYRFQEE